MGAEGASSGEGLSTLSVLLRLKIRNSHWWDGHEVTGDLHGSYCCGPSPPGTYFTRPNPKSLWVIIKNHCPIPCRTHVCSCVIPRMVLRFLFSLLVLLLNLRCSFFLSMGLLNYLHCSP